MESGAAGSGRRWLLAAGTGLIALLGIELGARAVELSHALIAGQQSNSFVRWVNRVRVFRESADGRFYERTPHHWIRRGVRFPVKKEAGTFRVFCLGGSAAMGWPHPAAFGYPALLRRKLEAGGRPRVHGCPRDLDPARVPPL